MEPAVPLRRLLLVAALATALWPQGLHGQRSSVRVRLFHATAITTVRVVPTGYTEWLPRCPGCKAVPLHSAVRVQINAGRLAGFNSTEASSGTLRGTFRIEAAAGPGVATQSPLEIAVEGRQVVLTTHVPLEEYVAATLAGEGSNFKSDEALKAMAVAIRSYAVHFMGRHKDVGFDFCDTTHCQDFRLGAVNDRFRQAAAATEGEILWSDGRPVAAYYHQDCGGHLEDPRETWGTAAPYLKQQEDRFCQERGRMQWETTLTVDDFRSILAEFGRVPAAREVNFEVLDRTRSGRARRVRIAAGSSMTATAERFRMAAGRRLGWNRLRSDLYHVDRVAGGWRFRGTGSGHGVGLCQTGAAQMGLAGRPYAEILSAYFAGTRIGINAQGLSWSRMSGEHVDVMTTRGATDRSLVGIADALTVEIEQSTGLRFTRRPEIRVYPSLRVFRDSTGEPGWVTGSTRGHIVRVPPPVSMPVRRILRHELLHVLVETRAAPALPLWFREGLVLYLAGEPGNGGGPSDLDAIDRTLRSPNSLEELERAYRQAAAALHDLVGRHGRAHVLSWIDTGRLQP